MKERVVRGQAGVEFLAVTGIGLLLIVGVSLFLLGQSRAQRDDAAIQQVHEIASTMIQQAQTVWSLGRNSWVTVDVTLPGAVRNITTTENNTIVIELDTDYGGRIEVPVFSPVPVDGGYGEPAGRGIVFGSQFRTGPVSIKVFNNGTNVLFSIP